MNLNLILFVILPFVLMLCICIGMPVYRKKLIKEAGEKLLSLAKKSTILSYFSAGIAVFLMFLSVKVNFGRFNFVIPYCAVLGLFLTLHSSYINIMIIIHIILLLKHVGTYYEHMIGIQPFHILSKA